MKHVGQRLRRVASALVGDEALDPARHRRRLRRLAAAEAEGCDLTAGEIVAEAERILSEATSRGLSGRELVAELEAERAVLEARR